MESLINEVSTNPHIVEIDERHRAVLDFGQKSARKGFLTWRELTHLLDCLESCPMRHWQRLNEEQVRMATRAAFARRARPLEALACLDGLPGVSLFAASAVLAWTDPDRFAAIDRHAWRALERFGLVQHQPAGTGLCRQDYAMFNEICRMVGDRLDRPAHWVDRWLYTRDRLDGGVWH
ncbi:hypothetical protein [Geminicoccus roseus]|uniref:hypothetical protein n=1 Tax=Geminicoccus roseus TaxID=404900 RepID=UPI0004259311|nr:hypothetical protein [Geminicoccus roseus]